jgi:hypothetical protein
MVLVELTFDVNKNQTQKTSSQITYLEYQPRKSIDFVETKTKQNRKGKY